MRKCIYTLALIFVSTLATANTEYPPPGYHLYVTCGTAEIKFNGVIHQVTARKEGAVSSGHIFKARAQQGNALTDIPGLSWTVTAWQQTGPTHYDDRGINLTPYLAQVELTAAADFQYASPFPTRSAAFTARCTLVEIDHFYPHP